VRSCRPLFRFVQLLLALENRVRPHCVRLPQILMPSRFTEALTGLLCQGHGCPCTPIDTDAPLGFTTFQLELTSQTSSIQAAVDEACARVDKTDALCDQCVAMRLAQLLGSLSVQVCAAQERPNSGPVLASQRDRLSDAIPYHRQRSDAPPKAQLPDVAACFSLLRRPSALYNLFAL
jgi:hypothetical protein